MNNLMKKTLLENTESLQRCDYSQRSEESTSVSVPGAGGDPGTKATQSHGT